MAALTTPAPSGGASGVTPQDDQPLGVSNVTAVSAAAQEKAVRLTRANAREESRKRWPEAQRLQVERLVTAMRQAMAQRGLSERALAREMGITLGTTQKYFTYQVLPGRMSTEVTARLAALLGVTVDALLRFFETGDYGSSIGWREVESWLRSSASSEHLAKMFEALTAAAQSGRLGGAPVPEGEPAPPPPYEWPILALAEAGISDALRERMGLSDDRLRALAVEGVFDDELVEAFSVATNIEADAVRDAFMQRQPVEGY